MQQCCRHYYHVVCRCTTYSHTLCIATLQCSAEQCVVCYHVVYPLVWVLRVLWDGVLSHTMACCHTLREVHTHLQRGVYTYCRVYSPYQGGVRACYGL